MNKANLKLLRFICLLTFIGSGFGIFITSTLFFQFKFIDFAQNIPLYTSYITNTKDAGNIYIVIRLVLYIVSFISAILIWKLKLKGYFLYIFTQFSMLAASLIFFNYPFNHTLTLIIPELIFVIAFILLYSLHLDLLISKKTIQEAQNS